MNRGLVVFVVVAVCAALPSVASATDVPTLGTTTTVTCTFAKGLTDCSQLSIRITGGTCYPAGVLDTAPTRLFFHDEFSSSRQYQGNAVLTGLNGTAVVGSFGDPPLDGDLSAWDDAIYASVVRPHAKLVATSGVTESRTNSFAVIVDDPTCA